MTILSTRTPDLLLRRLSQCLHIVQYSESDVSQYLESVDVGQLDTYDVFRFGTGNGLIL